MKYYYYVGTDFYHLNPCLNETLDMMAYRYSTDTKSRRLLEQISQRWTKYWARLVSQGSPAATELRHR